MSLFPTTIAGSMLDSVDDLIQLLDNRGRNNITDNPAQLSSAAGLTADQRDPQKAAAIAEACAVLLKKTNDAGVLLLCAHLGAAHHEAFYRAVVERLEGGSPIPDVPGTAEPTLVEELATTLASESFGRFPDLHRRAIAALKRRGLLRTAIHVLSSSDPNQQGADVLIALLKRGDVEGRMSTVVGLLIWRLAKGGSDRLLDVASALSGQPTDIRALGAKRAEQGNAGWWANHGGRFNAKAGLP